MTSHWVSILLINGQISVVDLSTNNGKDLKLMMVLYTI